MAGGEWIEVATFGGGCFWCIEALFAQLHGVVGVRSGYAGGSAPNPTYQEVCDGRTGHAEVVQIQFDAREVSFRQILEMFFSVHDPTTPNRQGADEGTQYRSIILYHTPEQKEAAETLIRELAREKVWRNPIVTEVVPFQAFYPAENYHQEYYIKNRNQPYCRVVIDPKVAAFREKFADKLKRGQAK